jgi:hypothetical protein
VLVSACVRACERGGQRANGMSVSLVASSHTSCRPPRLHVPMADPCPYFCDDLAVAFPVYRFRPLVWGAATGCVLVRVLNSPSVAFNQSSCEQSHGSVCSAAAATAGSGVCHCRRDTSIIYWVRLRCLWRSVACAAGRVVRRELRNTGL